MSERQENMKNKGKQGHDKHTHKGAARGREVIKILAKQVCFC